MANLWIAAVLAKLALYAQPGHGPMYHFPQWSPDGTQIVASSTLDGDSEIVLLSLGGGQTRQLTNNQASDDAARWTGNGSIVFLSDRRGRMEPFIMDADGANQRPIEALPPEPGSVSPDGRTRLVESVEGGRSVIVAQGAGGAKRVLTSGPHAEQGSYSPDGRRVVYEQRSPEAPDDIRRSGIVVANADGSAPRVVSPGTDPSWSPDGLLLLFKIWEPQKDELWIATAAADGAGFRRLAPGVHPHWSPDGRRIA
jgi:Tol biopolymer transport system component